MISQKKRFPFMKIQKEIELAEKNNTNLLKEKDKLKEEGIEWLRKPE
jgi:hypothetical protein